MYERKIEFKLYKEEESCGKELKWKMDKKLKGMEDGMR